MKHPYGDLLIDVDNTDESERIAWVSFYSEDEHGVTHGFELREGGTDGADRLRKLARALNDAADSIDAGERP